MKFTLHALLLAVAASPSFGFVAPQQKALLQERTILFSTTEADVNGATSTVAAPLVAASGNSNKSQLASAFAALDEGDQYDAVLTGLCAKILDEDADEEGALQDPITLMKEMNARRVKASGRSLMALIDATVQTQDASSMSTMMSLCLANGGVSQYGVLQNSVMELPPTPTSKVRGTDGTMKSRQDRLDDLADLPVDDRGPEVTSALAFSAFAFMCTMANVFGIDDISPYTNTLLFLLTTVGVVDNFYDVINFATDVSDTDVALPKKDTLPFGLGTGQVTGTVFRGLVRLTTVDTERDCECEAAAFYAAYVLGLPCYAFRPNALESAVMVIESSKKDSAARLDPLLSSVGMMKMLVWLLAPVAMESSKHAQLVMSDPMESRGLLERLEDKASSLLNGNGDLFWTESDQEKEDLLKWAYAEADYLLRENRGVVAEISQRLAGGAATVGDCVAVIEDW